MSSFEVDQKQVLNKISVIIVCSYLLKLTAKLTTGILFSLKPLIADGLHGIIDILEHGLLRYGGHIARKPDQEKYPLNREPLLDVLGLAIFGGLFLMGVSFLKEALLMIIGLLYTFNSLNIQLPQFFVKMLPEADGPQTDAFLIGGCLLMGCFVVSWCAANYQLSRGKKYKLPEMEADAVELKSDGILELVMGVSFLIGWVMMQIISGSSFQGNVNAVTAILNLVMLVAVSVYFIYISSHELYELYQNLMNVSLSRSTRIKLENRIKKSLPLHVELVDQLLTYYRGQQLFIKGHFRIDRNLVRYSDQILARLERIPQRFLSEIDLKINTQFIPIFSTQHKNAKEELEGFMKNEWSLDAERGLVKAFVLLRHGDLSGAISVLETEKIHTNDEMALSLYIRGECLIIAPDRNEELLESISLEMDSILTQQVSDNSLVLLRAWQLFYAVHKYHRIDNKQHLITSSRGQLEEALSIAVNISKVTQAEAHFALGFSWEMCSNFDLEKSRTQYRIAENFYFLGDALTESDRLLTTWGHMETLVWLLADAREHLERSLNIREEKEDNIGLSYTYGCFADLYCRLGDFGQADEFYQKDFDICDDLSLYSKCHSILIKRADMLIRAGMYHNQNAKIYDGIEVCRQADSIKLPTSGNDRKKSNSERNSFFSLKAKVKALLWLIKYEEDSEKREMFKTEIKGLLKSFDPRKEYEEAFCYRYEGRFKGIVLSDPTGGRECLFKAAALFQRMSHADADIFFSIQSLVCKIEIMFIEIYCGVPVSVTDNPVYSIENFVNKQGGLLGNAESEIRQLIDQYKSYEKKAHKDQKLILTPLERLISFLEG